MTMAYVKVDERYLVALEAFWLHALGNGYVSAMQSDIDASSKHDPNQFDAVLNTMREKVKEADKRVGGYKF